MDTQQQAAQAFVSRWRGRGYEKGQSQVFWMELLQLLGIAVPSEWIAFEDKVMMDHTSFLDGYIGRTRVLIEQKSLEKDLRAPIKQSDGSLLTPFQQAKRYCVELGYDRYPRWIVTCNFRSMLIYDMKQPNGEPEELLLENLPRELYRLKFLVDTGDEHIQREMEISLKAGKLVGMLYDQLLEQYLEPESEETLRSLNILCVRLVFCLYAEDAGVFPQHNMFHDYLASFQPHNVRRALIDLFRVLDTKPTERDPYMEENLRAFPYVNGGLFAEAGVEVPRFTEEIVNLLMDKASMGFDWSGISPTIFGAVFESTLNPVTRRTGGMHYTSIPNIHKVIDPLFLNQLHREFDQAASLPDMRQRNQALRSLQERISRLNFLDPACGSGNFLTETFISLRRLENDILKLLSGGQYQMGFEEHTDVKVSISQFYGIEINDFAATVAKTALWIAEHQMLRTSEMIVKHDLDFLPLKSYNNIRVGDALKMEWDKVEYEGPGVVNVYADYVNLVPQNWRVSEAVEHYGKINLHYHTITSEDPEEQKRYRTVRYDYIMGNPPFVGARMMSSEQKEALTEVFGKRWKNVGNLDLVCAWYKKAADLMHVYKIRTALVSTNSVCQGETVANLWQPLMRAGVHIDFAHTTFRWDSESDQMAHVHCVVVGFSRAINPEPCLLFTEGRCIECQSINAYLAADSPNVFVSSRSRALCEVPQMDFGNMPNDAKGMLSNLSTMEKDFLLAKYPELKPFVRRLYGAEEYINNKERWCLWFKGASPAILRLSPEVHQRIEAVKEAREKSPRAGTRKMAQYPYLFAEIRQPQTNYILVPSVSSERRRYVPMGFVSPDVIVNNSVQIIPDATLYHFGVLTSNVHMAWMRAVCGRLESRYRYSKDVVYNNFPWPTVDDGQRAKIELTAQGILTARALFPDSSLADLYDEAVMPPELRKAHQENDKAVMQAYGFRISRDFTEQDCVAALMRLYQQLTEQ